MKTTSLFSIFVLSLSLLFLVGSYNPGGGGSGVGVQLEDYSETIGTATVSTGVLTVNLANGNVQKHTLSENVTKINFTNITASVMTAVTLVMTQDSTARTVTFTNMEINSTAKTDLWAGATPPTMSTGSGDVDIFTFVVDPAGNRVFAFTGGQNFG